MKNIFKKYLFLNFYEGEKEGGRGKEKKEGGREKEREKETL
jgi:hypothetical protein